MMVSLLQDLRQKYVLLYVPQQQNRFLTTRIMINPDCLLGFQEDVPLSMSDGQVMD